MLSNFSEVKLTNVFTKPFFGLLVCLGFFFSFFDLCFYFFKLLYFPFFLLRAELLLKLEAIMG